MDDAARDRTQDWLLPERSKPPLLSELVERVDEALARSRSSEAAAISIGAAALDAADQARRAVDLAERAATAMFGPAASTQMRGPGQPSPSPSVAPRGPDAGRRLPGAAGATGPRKTFGTGGDEGLRGFSARADQVMARLRALERLPVSA